MVGREVAGGFLSVLFQEKGHTEMKMIFSFNTNEGKNGISKCGELLFTFLSKQEY